MRSAAIGRLLGDRGPLGASLAAVILGAAWVSTWRPQVDPDAWWHLVRGGSIISDGAIPTVETSSWLTEGQRLISHSWLWDVLLAQADRLAGATGMSLLILPVTAAIVGLVWLLLSATAPDVPPIGRAILVLVAMIAALPLWAPRGQTLDVAFVLAAAWILSRYLGSGSIRPLIALPILGVAWANMHGSGILGLAATIVAAVAGGLIEVRCSRYSVRRVGILVAVGLVAVLATSINPYGPALLAYPFDRSIASAFSSAIVEWRPPDFGAPELVPYRLLLVAAVLSGVGWRHRVSDPFLLLAAAGWTLAALGAARFITISSALLVVALGPAMFTAVPGWPRVGSGDPPSDTADPVRAEIGRAPSVGLSAVALVAILAVGWTIIGPSAQAAAIGRRSPVAAVAALESLGCEGRLLPDYGWAGYVAWATGRQVGAYGDSPAPALSDQFALETLRVDPAAWFDGHRVDVVLMTAGSALSRWLDAAVGWRLAYDDGQATIHARATEPGCQPGA